MTQHTAGPWFVNGPWNIQADTHEQTPNIVATITKRRDGSVDEREANARLIASAPSMLATLRAIAADCEQYLNDDLEMSPGDLCQAFLKAINEVHDKATGSTFASDDPVDEADYEGTGCGRADFDNELCCQRCGSELCDVDGHCRDETCPYSDRKQDETFVEG